jgi:RHS repeat-associated protein
VSAPGQDGYAAEARAALGQAGARTGFLASGYQRGTAVLGAPGAGQWWMRSGVAGFAASAPDHFYLPERYLDPFGNETSLAYDGDYLFVRSSTDPVGNRTRVIRFDHRVLAPSRVEDHNDNVTAAAFDVFGLPVATAQMGKVSAGPPESSETGDTVEKFTFANLNPHPDRVAGFFLSDRFDAVQARKWLGRATARFLYHFGESTGAHGHPVWGTTAAGACGIVRERHQRDAPNTAATWSPIQATVEYSDGAGRTFVKKIQAEPDPGHPGRGIRWIANGKTIVNNKGNPVLQYEPYFSDSGHRFAEPRPIGVSPVLYYDAPGRLMRTEFPDGSVSRIEFSPWLSRSYDQNDTVRESGNRWYAEHTTAGAETAEKRAARLAALHAGTPAETHLDSLGRSVIAIARNRSPDEAHAPATATSVADWPWTEERYLTFTKLDTEGKPLWICDGRGNLVMQYIAPAGPDHTPLYDVAGRDYHPAYVMPPSSVPCYDIAGNLLFQHSMDAGDRRMLMDAAGQPVLAWDYNERKDATTPRLFKEHRRVRVVYDTLRRPLERWLRVRDESTGATHESLVERFRYGEGAASAKRLNLRGKIWQHYDSSGVAQTDEFDRSDKPRVSRRRLASDIETPVLDWNGVQLHDIHVNIAAGFEPEVFTQRTDYDALGRATRMYNWHVESPDNSGRSDRVAVYLPSYSERGLLAKETLLVRARKTPGGHQIVSGTTRRQDAIKRIDYDAKGQKTRLDCGNGTVTQYDYDPRTCRLRVLRTTRPGYRPRFPSKRGQLSDARVLQHLFYSYDASGNITEIQDDAWTPAFFGNQRVEAASRYVYDSIDRLVEASGRENGRATGAPPQLTAATMLAAFPETTSGALRNYVERYRYDAVGNTETMRHVAGPLGSWTRTYDYETASNRLTGTGTDNPARAVTYGYDTHGSMTNLNAAPERFDLRWDWNDMIRTIDLGGGGRAWYQYGADKERCRKRIDRQHNTAGSWERICLPGFELYRRYGGAARGAPVEEIETHHLFEREQRVLLVDDVITAADVAHPRPDGLPVHQQTLFRYQYGNLLGSANLELDDTMELISYEEYHPYGSSAYHAVNSTVEAPPKRYRYTGMERDEETGLNYHYARYLSTSLGRWLSSDPLSIRSGLNCWLYSNDNPICFVDPNGARPRTPQEEQYITYLSDLAAQKEAQISLANSLWAALPPFGRSARSDATVLRTHIKRLSDAIERAKEGEGVRLLDVEHQARSAKYTWSAEGRDFDPYVKIAAANGALIEVQTDPEYMTAAEFRYRADVYKNLKVSWEESGMAVMTAFNALVGSMGDLEAGSTSEAVRPVWRASVPEMRGWEIRHVVGEYAGEHLQDNTVWPGGKQTLRFTPEIRRRFQLKPSGGLLLDIRGRPFDTSSGEGGRAIFVMDPFGNIYAYPSTGNLVGRLHHSTLVGGEPVAMAGEMKVTEGRVTVISDKSGHYQTTREMMNQFNEHLERLGIDVSNIQLEYFKP